MVDIVVFGNGDLNVGIATVQPGDRHGQKMGGNAAKGGKSYRASL